MRPDILTPGSSGPQTRRVPRIRSTAGTTSSAQRLDPHSTKKFTISTANVLVMKVGTGIPSRVKTVLDNVVDRMGGITCHSEHTFRRQSWRVNTWAKAFQYQAGSWKTPSD